MRIAVIGGGINGLMISRQLLLDDHDVTLFDKDSLMLGTSSRSTKLIHGGLRYLEYFQLLQVRESLLEREFWLNYSPQFVKPIKFILPVYKTSRRRHWKYSLGLTLYDHLASKKNIQNYQVLTKEQIIKLDPNLYDENLLSGFLFYDAQMNDYELGMLVAQEILEMGVRIFENKEVTRVNIEGKLYFSEESFECFDRIINVTGPSAEKLLSESNISSDKKIDLIRGSHLVFDEQSSNSFLLESPIDERIFFVISYMGKTLLGTTEVRQELNETIEPSKEEIEYLLYAYNSYFKKSKSINDIDYSFSGVRPLIRSHNNLSRITRDYTFEKNGRLISVFGGKWTSSRKLAEKLSKYI